MSNSKYMDGVFVSKKSFPNGGSVINMDIIPDKLIEWLKNCPRTEKGYTKVQIQSKKEPEVDNFGNIKMFCALNDYFHKDQQQQPPQQSYTPPSSTAPDVPQFDDNADIDGSELPF